MRPAQKTYTPRAAFVAESLPTSCQVFARFSRMHAEFALEIFESQFNFSLICRDFPPTCGDLRADNARRNGKVGASSPPERDAMLGIPGAVSAFREKGDQLYEVKG